MQLQMFYLRFQPNIHSPLTSGRRPPVMRDKRILYPVKRKFPPQVKKPTVTKPSRKRKDTRITFALTGLTLQRVKIENALVEAGYRLVSRSSANALFADSADYVIVGDE